MFKYLNVRNLNIQLFFFLCNFLSKIINRTQVITDFPALNGPFAPINAEDLESEYVADYTIGEHVIYVSFRWSVAERAYSTMFELAEKHQVGFYDASGSGDILFPNQKGELDSILPRIERRKWWKIWKKAL